MSYICRLRFDLPNSRRVTQPSLVLPINPHFLHIRVPISKCHFTKPFAELFSLLGLPRHLFIRSTVGYPVKLTDNNAPTTVPQYSTYWTKHCR